MTDAELLRAMAQWYRDGHTFTPDYGRNQCGCFMRAKNSVLSVFEPDIRVKLSPLGEIVGLGFDTNNLIEAGWTGPECTDDAIAACEIAADLAS